MSQRIAADKNRRAAHTARNKYCREWEISASLIGLCRKRLDRAGIPRRLWEEAIQDARIAVYKEQHPVRALDRWIANYVEGHYTSDGHRVDNFTSLGLRGNNEVLKARLKPKAGPLGLSEAQPPEILAAVGNRVDPEFWGNIDTSFCPRCYDPEIDIAVDTNTDDEGVGGNIGLCHKCGFAFAYHPPKI